VHSQTQRQGAPCKSLRLNPSSTRTPTSHPLVQYPPDTRHIYSYLESSRGMFEETMLAMLQTSSNPISPARSSPSTTSKRLAASLTRTSPAIRKLSITRASNLSTAKHGGRPPAAHPRRQGSTVVKTHNALITIENTDPEFYWLTNWRKRSSSKSGIPLPSPRFHAPSSRS